MKKTLAGVLLGLAALLLTACGSSDKDVVSRNISTEADQFRIERRIAFINGITDQYMLTITGKCAIEDQGIQLEVTCMVGPDQYKKHFLGKSQNVVYIVEQLDGANVGRYHYEVIFKPESLIPDVRRP